MPVPRPDRQGEETRFAMAAPIPLRGDYDAKALRRLAKRSDDADQTRRLLALAAVYDGGSRSTAAAIGGVGLQTVRDWVLHFKSDALDPAHRRLLAAPHPVCRRAEALLLEDG